VKTNPFKTPKRNLETVTAFEASPYLDIYHPRARKRNVDRQGFAIQTGGRIERTGSGCAHRVDDYLLARAPNTAIAAHCARLQYASTD
jgi:hypothetical protein